MGTKYRMPAHPVVVDVVYRQKIIDDTLHAGTLYAQRLEVISGVPGSMAAWRTLATTRLTEYITGTLPLGTTIVPKHPHRRHSDQSPGFSPAVLHHPFIRSLRRELVVTYMDKSDTTFIVYCRPHYNTTICRDLCRFPLDGHSAFSHVHRPVQEILTEDAAFLTSMGVRPLDNPTLPLYAGIAKMHKSPVATRFLTLSHNAS